MIEGVKKQSNSRPGER